MVNFPLISERFRLSMSHKVYHFRKMDLCPATLLLFAQHGYTAWSSDDGGGIAETSDEDWEAIKVPRGEQDKLRRGLKVYKRDRKAYHEWLSCLQRQMVFSLLVFLL